jgi:gas vesicle protein
MKSDSPAAAAPAAAKVPAADNIHQIRDILFGAQMEEYESRFKALEADLLAESGKLRDEIRKRFDQLAAKLQASLNTVNEEITAEQTVRGQSSSELSAAIKDLNKALERAADDLSKRLQKNGDTLQNQIQKQREDLTELITRSVEHLQDVKTDRAALAELLSGVAAQLHHDSEAATAKARGRK